MYDKWYELSELLSQKIMTDSDVQRIVDLCESLIYLSSTGKLIPVPYMNADGFRKLIRPIQSEYQAYLDKRKEMGITIQDPFRAFLDEEPPILMGPPDDDEVNLISLTDDEIELNLGPDLTNEDVPDLLAGDDPLNLIGDTLS